MADGGSTDDGVDSGRGGPADGDSSNGPNSTSNTNNTNSAVERAGNGQPVTIKESLDHLTTGVATLARQSWAAYGGAVLISIAATVMYITILLSAWLQGGHLMAQLRRGPF